jgi:alginate O-acetyltransferase complex protein AlgI
LIFNSLQYGVFLVAVFLLYWRLGHRNQNRFLLLASYVFYAAWDWRFLSLILFSTTLDYTVARLLDRTAAEGRRKALLLTSVGANLSLLGVFKYFGFFADSLQSLLDGLGLEVLAPTVDIILPVGISFYTFQTISYTFDVYRRRIPASRDPLDVAVYVAFFPQLVAGPIERANHFMPQVQARRTFPTGDAVKSALGLLALGLFKKVVIADNLAAAVDEVYGDPASHGSLTLMLATYAFAFQIYADFSAYTDMARGSARLLGFELLVNFRQPYLSRNIQVFWRTWHISLSNWLRDYLYVPLGGNRGTERRTTINLMLVMLLGGLWHGASWNFVIWGGLQGLFLGAHRLLTRQRHEAPDAVPRLGDAWAILATFHAVCFAWIFFRAETFTDASQVIARIAALEAGATPPLALQYLALAPIVLLIDFAQRAWRDETFFVRWAPELQGAAFAAFGIAILVFGVEAGPDFVYFQF